MIRHSRSPAELWLSSSLIWRSIVVALALLKAEATLTGSVSQRLPALESDGKSDPLPRSAPGVVHSRRQLHLTENSGLRSETTRMRGSPVVPSPFVNFGSVVPDPELGGVGTEVEKVAKEGVEVLHMQHGIGLGGWLLVQLVLLLVIIGIAYLVACTSKPSRAQEVFEGVLAQDEQHLQGVGLAATDHSEWGERAQGHARIVEYLSIDADGGLDRIHTEFFTRSQWGRLLRFVSIFVGGLGNVAYLSWTSIRMLDAYCLYLSGVHIMELAALERWKSMGAEMRHEFLPYAAFIAMVELTVITGLLALIVQNVAVFLTISEPFRRYDSLRVVVWELTPLTTTFSALKGLRVVHPEQASEDITLALKGNESYLSKGLTVAWFGVSRCCVFMVGLLAFGVKIVESGAFFQDVDTHILLRWAFVAGFLYQAMTIVVLDNVFNQRVLRVFFGGHTGDISEWEILMMRVYQIRVLRAVYRFYSGWNRVALLLTFNHNDFQRLFLEEDVQKKERLQRTSTVQADRSS